MLNFHCLLDAEHYEELSAKDTGTQFQAALLNLGACHITSGQTKVDLWHHKDYADYIFINVPTDLTRALRTCSSRFLRIWAVQKPLSDEEKLTSLNCDAHDDI